MKNANVNNNNIKARIDKTQQNSRCRLCGDRDETIDYIISNVALKVYKTYNDWVGKVIHLEFSKKLKFDRMNKWYMHHLESFLVNKMQKLLWDFEIETDHLISMYTYCYFFSGFSHQR